MYKLVCVCGGWVKHGYFGSHNAGLHMISNISKIVNILREGIKVLDVNTIMPIIPQFESFVFEADTEKKSSLSLKQEEKIYAELNETIKEWKKVKMELNEATAEFTKKFEKEIDKELQYKKAIEEQIKVLGESTYKIDDVVVSVTKAHEKRSPKYKEAFIAALKRVNAATRGVLEQILEEETTVTSVAQAVRVEIKAQKVANESLLSDFIAKINKLLRPIFNRIRSKVKSFESAAQKLLSLEDTVAEGKVFESCINLEQLESELSTDGLVQVAEEILGAMGIVSKHIGVPEAHLGLKSAVIQASSLVEKAIRDIKMAGHRKVTHDTSGGDSAKYHMDQQRRFDARKYRDE